MSTATNGTRESNRPPTGRCTVARRSRRARAAAIARWEDEPLDPNDSLSLISDYPDEVRRLREFQAAVKADPVYQVVNRIGGAVRRRFLDATGGAGPSYDEDTAAEFFVAEVCRCDPPAASFDEDTEREDRCRRCREREDLEQARREALRAEVAGEWARCVLDRSA